MSLGPWPMPSAWIILFRVDFVNVFSLLLCVCVANKSKMGKKKRTKQYKRKKCAGMHRELDMADLGAEFMSVL